MANGLSAEPQTANERVANEVRCTSIRALSGRRKGVCGDVDMNERLGRAAPRSSGVVRRMHLRSDEFEQRRFNDRRKLAA
jgi:hypothetical protein